MHEKKYWPSRWTIIISQCELSISPTAAIKHTKKRQINSKKPENDWAYKLLADGQTAQNLFSYSGYVMFRNKAIVTKYPISPFPNQTISEHLLKCYVTVSGLNDPITGARLQTRKLEIQTLV